MRFFINIIIILVICFSATIVPFNANFYTPKLKMPEINLFKKESVEVTSAPTSYSTNASDQLFNPSQIEFTMFSSFDKAPFKIGTDHDLILKVYDHNDRILYTFKNLEFVSEIITDVNIDSQLSYKLNLSRDNLNIDPGDYKFKINSSSKKFEDIEPLELVVTYIDPINYTSQPVTPNENQLVYTLYYPNNTLEYLIPSTVLVEKETNPNLGIIKAIQTPPNHSIFYDKQPIPNVNKIWSKNNRLYLHLPYNIGSFNKDKTLGDMALKTILENYAHIDGINSIQFLKGERYVKKYMAGNNLRYPLEPVSKPKYFVPQKHVEDKILLIPKEIDSEVGVNTDYVNLMIESLKSVEGISSIQIIPDYVLVRSTAINEGILTIDFDKSLITAFGGESNYQHLILDTLVFSFTTIPGVDAVKINIGGNESSTFAGEDLSTPIYPVNGINMIN